jgi:hypothetical protein
VDSVNVCCGQRIECLSECLLLTLDHLFLKCFTLVIDTFVDSVNNVVVYTNESLNVSLLCLIISS